MKIKHFFQNNYTNNSPIIPKYHFKLNGGYKIRAYYFFAYFICNMEQRNLGTISSKTTQVYIQGSINHPINCTDYLNYTNQCYGKV